VPPTLAFIQLFESLTSRSGPAGGFLSLVLTVLWIWILVDCVRNDPDWRSWIWLLVFIPWIGALIYFAVRKAPRMRVRVPAIPLIRRWTRRHEIWSAEADARNIGNARHHIRLGDLMIDTGQYDKALEAYTAALERDGQDPRSLWGVAAMAERNRQFDRARDCLARLAQQDPDYRSGEATLAYARVLLEQQNTHLARTQIERYLAKWSRPEAKVMYAQILRDDGDPQRASEMLTDLLVDVRSMPTFAQRDPATRAAVRKAKKLRRSMPTI